MAIRTTRRQFVFGAAAVPVLACPAIAQAGFPSRPIRIVIGFPPGGGIDILARLMGGSPEEFAALIKSDTARWDAVLQGANLGR